MDTTLVLTVSHCATALCFRSTPGLLVWSETNKRTNEQKVNRFPWKLGVLHYYLGSTLGLPVFWSSHSLCLISVFISILSVAILLSLLQLRTQINSCFPFDVDVRQRWKRLCHQTLCRPHATNVGVKAGITLLALYPSAHSLTLTHSIAMLLFSPKDGEPLV